MQILSAMNNSFLQFNNSYNANMQNTQTNSVGCSCNVCDICLGKENSIQDSEKKSHKDQKTDKNSEEKSSVNDKKLDASEEEQVKKLQARDAEVRAHEAAHIAAGGSVVSGGASFTYQQGPDGKSYAIGGEVPIDVSAGKTPEETIAKMQKVRSAAMAPADPSPQDYKVASTATILEMQARIELMQEKNEELKEKSKIYEENATVDASEELESFDLSA